LQLKTGKGTLRAGVFLLENRRPGSAPSQPAAAARTRSQATLLHERCSVQDDGFGHFSHSPSLITNRNSGEKKYPAFSEPASL